jgi:hypothetical protein
MGRTEGGRLKAMAAALLASSCSCIVNFDDPQPCYDGRCLPGFTCSDASVCEAVDGGFDLDAGSHDAGSHDAGTADAGKAVTKDGGRADGGSGG